jgi:hypothetical protein
MIESFEILSLFTVGMKHLVLITEILVLALVLGALWLDFKFPCDSRIKILLLIVVGIKIVLIIYLSRQEGEKKGYAECEAQSRALARPTTPAIVSGVVKV